MKKLEIIFPMSIAEEVLEELINAGLPGYTIFKSHKSYGQEHGESLEFGFSGSQDSYYLISVSNTATINAVLDKTTDKLKAKGALIFDSNITIY